MEGISFPDGKRPSKLAKRVAKAARRKEFRKELSRLKKPVEVVSNIEQLDQEKPPLIVENHGCRAGDSQSKLDDKLMLPYKAQLDMKLLESYSSERAVKVCIDLSFIDLSSFIDVPIVDEKWFTVEKEINSITKQLALSYSTLRKHLSQIDDDAPPIRLQITSLPNVTAASDSTRADGRYALALHDSLMKQGFQNWKLGREHSPPWELYPKETVVILSPDAETALQDFDVEKVYVICGIVDRTVKKGWSLQRANDLGLSCYRLPIQEMVAQRRTHILNINHVLHAICAYTQFGDWATALDIAMPQRKKGGGSSS